MQRIHLNQRVDRPDHHRPKVANRCVSLEPRERQDLHTTQGIRRSEAMQVYHRLRRQCTLFMVNHAGHADWTFRSPKRRNRLPAGNARRYEWMAINWLEWEALQSRQSIRHQGNDSEKINRDETFTRGRILQRHQHRLRILWMSLARTSMLDDQNI